MILRALPVSLSHADSRLARKGVLVSVYLLVLLLVYLLVFLVVAEAAMRGALFNVANVGVLPVGNWRCFRSSHIAYRCRFWSIGLK